MYMYVCMYLCMYMYVTMYTFTCMYVRIFVQLYVHAYICPSAYLSVMQLKDYSSTSKLECEMTLYVTMVYSLMS